MKILSRIVNFFLSPPRENSDTEGVSILFDRFGEPLQPAIRLAAIALLTRTAWADGHLNQAECETVYELVHKEFALDEVHTKEVVHAAFKAEDTSLDRLTTVVKRSFDNEQRLLILELVWRVVIADHTIADPETRMVTSIGEALGLNSEQIRDCLKRVS